jgi:hypothetical protein
MTGSRNAAGLVFAGPRGRRGGTSPAGHRCGQGLGAVAACDPALRPSMRLVFRTRAYSADPCEVRSKCRALSALLSMSLLTAGLGKHQYQ